MRGREPKLLCGVVRVESDRGQDKVVSIRSHESGDDSMGTDKEYGDEMARVLLVI